MRIWRDAPAQAPHEKYGCNKPDDHHQAIALHGYVDERYLEELGKHNQAVSILYT